MSSILQDNLLFFETSLRVLKRNKDLLVLPLLNILCIAILCGIGLDVILITRNEPNIQNTVLLVISAAVLFFLAAFLAQFFNAALSACTIARLQNQDQSVLQGILIAMRNFVPLIKWTLLNGSVGFLFKLTESSNIMLGEMVSFFLDLKWMIASFFVIPLIVNDGLSPIEALNRIREVFDKKIRKRIMLTMLFILPVIALIIAAYCMTVWITVPILNISIFMKITLGILMFSVFYSFGNTLDNILQSAAYLNRFHNIDPLDIDFKVIKKTFMYD